MQTIASVAKSLRAQLSGKDQMPGHVELLNMLARSTGYRNYQHFRANAAGARSLERAPATPAVAEIGHIMRVARHFDHQGRLIRWPARTSHQDFCLWVLWAAFPARIILAEREVDALLNARHCFGDHALLRRALCSAGLIVRRRDGSAYRRVECQPRPDALALIRHLKLRTTRVPDRADCR